ncbi:hypothetical protein DFH28DRAFT_899622 [Melampsora americana]|nr:hypothetical protein DFH28DRAFT_899622 [Melampsora americana]
MSVCFSKSPEIFLNSRSFQTLYYNREIQAHLVLKVVDEAHCIHLWGLLESGASRHFSVPVNLHDIEIVCSSYGSLGQHLMSVTCQLQSVSAMLESLSITRSHITMISGKLSRPELRFSPIYLNHTLESAEDLDLIIPHKSVVANEDLPPIITQNATLDVIETVCKACGQPMDSSNGNRNCIHRYHSVTSNENKVKNARVYGEVQYPMILATSALGLGQNSPCVRIVVIMGAMDPSDSNTMAGRAAVAMVTD